MSDRIGIFGGTFDPPHVGHLIAVETARRALDLREVRFVVSGRPWMKGSESDAAHRVAMTKLAVAGNDAFVVDTQEVDRPGPSYTVDTLRAISAGAADAELQVLIGADVVGELPRWKDVQACFEMARFHAMTRPGYGVAGDTAVAVHPLDVPLIDVSSTDLRKRFAEGASVRYEVPQPVEEYVRKHRLYRAA